MRITDFGNSAFGFFNAYSYIKLIPICFLILNFSLFSHAVDIQQIDDETVKNQIKKVERLVRDGNLIEAESILRRVLEENPHVSKVRTKLAFVLFKQKRLLEAYNLSFDVAKAEPKNSYAFALLGMIMLETGSFKEAEIALLTALNLDKRESLGWFGLGLLDFYENRIVDSLSSLSQALNLDYREPNYIFAYAQVAARDERYAEAADAYRQFLHFSSKKDVDRRERIKGLIDFLEFLAGKASLYTIAGTPQTTVRFTLLQDRPVVQLRINKSDEIFNFVLDTGSGISVVSTKTAKRLKIGSVARGGYARGFGGDGKFKIVYGFLNRVGIGDVELRNVPVYIREFHSANEEIDGYIGLSLVSKFLTTIDYGNKSFTLRKKDGTGEKFEEQGGIALPLRLTSGGFLSGEVQIEGIENSLNFIVDTGASLSVISDDLAQSRELRNFAIDERIRVIGSAGETVNVPMFLLPRVTFGNNTRDRIRAIVLDLDMINEASGFAQSGILGGNFLKNYRMTFDFKNSKVIFVPLNE